MAKVFIRYPTEWVNDAGRMVTRYAQHEVNGYSFDGCQWVNVCDIPKEGRFEIRCNRCKGNDWTENGRFINEFECASCGNFIQVEPRNQIT